MKLHNLRSAAYETSRSIVTLSVMVGGSLAFGMAVHAAPTALYVTDPVSCPSEHSSFPGQKCSGGLDICGYVVTPTGDVAQCYDTSTMVDPAAPATSNTQYSSGHGGGFVLNCFALADGAAPFCDNAGAWLCNRDASCYTTKQRDTACAAPAGDVGAFSCGSCRTGYQDCLGDDACEVQTGVTNYPTGGNNNYAASCAVQCDSGYLDCDASGAGAGNGCEIQDGASCSVGGVTGTYNGCTCVPQKQYFETGTNTAYGTADPLLWGTQYGSGKLISFNNGSGEQFAVYNSGALRIGNFADGTGTGAGTMRWTGTDFEGYDGSVWISLTGATGSLDDMYVNVAGDAMTGALTIDLQGLTTGVGLEVIETISGSTIFANRGLSTSGSLVWEGAASGASLWVSTFEGAGLADCDLAADKIVWDATTKQFDCAVDMSVGTGLDEGTGDARYVNIHGDSMTGSLVIDLQGLTTGVGLEVIETISGSTIFANRGLSTSGSLVWEGAASGASLYVATSLRGSGLTDCDLSSQKLQWDSLNGRFSCGIDGGVPGNETFSGSVLTLIRNYSGSLLHLQTISGTTLHTNTSITTSGSITWETFASGASLWVSTFSGAGLTDCDLSTQKLLYDAQTERFVCGTDQNTGGAGTDIFSGSVLTLINNYSGSLLHLNTVSGSIIHANNTLTSSGTLTWETFASGASLWVSTFSGAGLTDCDLSTQKLLYDAQTERFVCGTDQEGAGSVTAGQGLTKNGSVLTLNASISGSLLEFQTVSGALVYARNTLASSGALVVEGDSIMNGSVQLGDDSGDTISMNGLLGTSIFLNANNSYQLGDATNRWGAGSFAQLYTEHLRMWGMSECVLEVDFDGDVFCGFGGGVTAGQGLGSSSNVLTLNSSISGSLLEFQTVSGALVYAERQLSVSGSVVLGDDTGDSIVFNGDIDSHFNPNTNTAYDMGNAFFRWKKGWFQSLNTSSDLGVGSTATINGNVGIGGGGGSPTTTKAALNVFGTISGSTVYAERQLSVSGSVILGDDTTSNVVFNADVNSNIVPNVNNSFDLGSSSARWANGWFNNANLSAGLSVLGTSSLTGNVGIGSANTTTKATLNVGGIMSGVTVYATRSFSGAGLSDCDADNQTLHWDATTGRFSCGDDDTGASSLTAGQGLSLNASVLTLNATITGSLVRFTTVSGSTVYANQTVRTDGIVESKFGLIFMDGGLLNHIGGFTQSMNLVANGLSQDSIQRLTAQGNLVNIGSVQAGETLLTRAGTFASAVSYTAGPNSYSTGIAMGDVNGDGKADIAVASAINPVVSVFLNNGDGTYAAETDYTSSPTNVTFGDVNGDGMPDMVTAEGNNFGVFMNNGNGTFATKVQVSSAGSNIYNIVVADLNDDGKQDIAFPSYSSASFSVYFNNGNGTFSHANADSYSTGSAPEDIAIGDVNGDGRLDVVVSNYTSGTVSVFINLGNGLFNTKVDYAAGASVEGVAVADVNGDKKPDIVSVSHTNSAASVFLNNGNGTFAAKVDYTTASNPQDVIVTDVNGDGKPDIVASAHTNAASVLINNGNGTFAAKVDYTLPGSAKNIAFGDANGDGKVDLATSNYINTSNVSVLINQSRAVLYAATGTGGAVGIGTLTPGSALSVSGALLINPNGTIANTRADAGLALELIGTASGRVLYAQQSLRSSGSLVWEGAGSGNSLIVSSTLGLGVGSVDSGLKLEIAGMASGRILYALESLRSSGSLVWEGAASGASLYVGSSIRGAGLVTDCDTAGTSKLLWDATTGRFSCGTDQTSGGTTYTAGQGLTLTSTSFKLNTTITGSTLRMSSGISASGSIISVGDITTKSGALVTRYGLVFMSGGLMNQTSGFNQNVNIVASGLSQDGIQRMNKMGNLVNIGSIQAGETLLTRGGRFAAKVDYTTGTSPYSVAIGDLNGDGKADMAVANASSTSVSVFLNRGNGTFISKVDYTTGVTPTFVAISDLNGDGKADMAVTNSSNNSVSIFLNNGNGAFAAKVDYATGSYPFSVAIGDLNGDGKADIAVANNTATSTSVLINRGNGTFAAKVDYATASDPISVAIGDVNGDGKADMAVANFGSTSASIFLNNGDGTFASKIDYATGVNPRSIAIGDVNGDGKADMVVANFTDNTTSVLINRGNGTFASKVDYATASSPISVAIGDVNGDGKADMAVTNSSSTSVSVFLNESRAILYAATGTGGAVGIGTFTPGSALSVSGAMIINPNGTITNTRADVGLALEVIGTASGRVLYAQESLRSSGSLVWEGAGSGASLYTGSLGVRTVSNDVAFEVLGVASGSSLFGQFFVRSSGSMVVENNLWVDSGTLLVNGTTNKVGIGTANPVAKLHVYNTENSNSNVYVEVDGAQNNQAAMLALVSKGDGASDLNAANTRGWMINVRGDSWANTNQQNDLEFDYWDGSAYRRSMHIDSVTGWVALGPQAMDTFIPDATIEVLGTASGAKVYASSALASSGTLVWDGAGSGSSLTVGGGTVAVSRSGSVVLNNENASTTANVFEIITDASTNENKVFRIQANGATFSDNAYNSSGADYAEWFFTSSTGVQPGDVVCIDVTKANTVKRCDRDGDGNVMGIVSTNPAFIGNVLSGADGLPVPGTVLVGLIGQVPAKVIASGSGGIRPGDSLTAASKPGFARKALPGESTVGVALEPFDGAQGDSGTINVLISRRNQSLTVSAVEQEVLEQIQAMEIGDELELMVAEAMGDLDVDQAIVDEVTRQVESLNVRDAVAEEVARQVADVRADIESSVPDIDTAGCDVAGSMLRWNADAGRFTCSSAPILVQETGSSSVVTEGSDLIASTLQLRSTLAVDSDARIAGDLFLDGGLYTNDLFIPGILAVDGSLTSSSLAVTGDADIHGTTTLHGKLILGSGSSLQFGSGLTLADLIVERSLAVLGDVTVDGLARFLGDVVVEGELSVTRQAGRLIVPVGATGATFTFEPAFTGTPVVTASPNKPVLFAVSVATSTGFTVSLAAPAENDITFSWLALIIPASDEPVSDAVSGALLGFPVDDRGVPVSSSLPWNACIRGIPLYDASGVPFSCSRYHDGNTWEQPDLNVSFVWNDNVTPPYMRLPDGYGSTVTETSASIRAAIAVVNGEQQPASDTPPAPPAEETPVVTPPAEEPSEAPALEEPSSEEPGAPAGESVPEDDVAPPDDPVPAVETPSVPETTPAPAEDPAPLPEIPFAPEPAVPVIE